MKIILPSFLLGGLLMNVKAEPMVLISVGSKKFVADVEKTATGQAFMEKLPLTLSMNELNGNEKYCYGVTLPTASHRYDVIEAGDLMLYGSNCIVLFYDTAGGYSYTRIGKLKSTDGLAEALGNGSVSVVFEKVRLEAAIRMVNETPEIGIETNLPSEMKITILAAPSLSISEDEWKDYETLTQDEKKQVRFFKLRAAE